MTTLFLETASSESAPKLPPPDSYGRNTRYDHLRDKEIRRTAPVGHIRPNHKGRHPSAAGVAAAPAHTSETRSRKRTWGAPNRVVIRLISPMRSPLNGFDVGSKTGVRPRSIAIGSTISRKLSTSGTATFTT